MQTVLKTGDILTNCLTLQRYLASARIETHDFAASLIRRGKCFLPVMVSGALTFSPSRFISYRLNDRAAHIRNVEKHSRDTTVWLVSILGSDPDYDREMEQAFAEFCFRHGIDYPGAIARNHRFWPTEVMPTNTWLAMQSDEDLEIAELYNDTSLSETTRLQLALARRGQGNYRRKLDRLWDNNCAVTGCRQRELLRASHIKPWRASNNEERLDPENGLLLAAHLDAAFDHHLISFDETGILLTSPKLQEIDRVVLGVTGRIQIKLSRACAAYMETHRAIFELG